MTGIELKYGIKKTISKIQDSICLVAAHTDDGIKYSTGFVYLEAGYIATSLSAEEARLIVVTFSHSPEQYIAQVLQEDEANKLSILSIANSTVNPLKSAANNFLQVGDGALIIGYPSEEKSFTAVHGMISSLEKESKRELIYVDFKASGKFAGCPIVNQYGCIIGIMQDRQFNYDKMSGWLEYSSEGCFDMPQEVEDALEFLGENSRFGLGIASPAKHLDELYKAIKRAKIANGI